MFNTIFTTIFEFLAYAAIGIVYVLYVAVIVGTILGFVVLPIIVFLRERFSLNKAQRKHNDLKRKIMKLSSEINIGTTTVYVHEYSSENLALYGDPYYMAVKKEEKLPPLAIKGMKANLAKMEQELQELDRKYGLDPEKMY